MSWLITGSEKNPTDPFRSQVSLLLHGDGANGSTTITDSSPSPKTVTAVGNAQISTAQSKFGGASIALDGTDDYLTVPSSDDLKFGTGSFTIEGWFYATAFVNALAGLFSLGRFDDGILLRYQGLNVNSNQNLWITGTAYDWQPYNNLSLNTWTHIALGRSESTVRLFVNGVVVLAVINSASIAPTTTTTIGSSTHALTNAWAGNIDDLRITKGVARYTANFTPPTAPFPDI